jgi:hypothetical protein
MIDAVLRILFRCPHRNMSRPMTPVRREGLVQSGTYVVCLDCGTQQPYDWEKMRVGRAPHKSRPEPFLEREAAEPSSRAAATRS